MLYQFRKRRNKRYLIIASIRDLNIRLVYSPEPPAESMVKAKGPGIQALHARPTRWVVSALRFPEVKTRRQPRALGTRKLRITYAVRSTKTYGISQGNVSRESKERGTSPARLGERTGPNVLSVLGPRAKSPRFRQNVMVRQNLEIRKKASACEDRQLLTPRRRQKWCREAHGSNHGRATHSFCLAGYRRRSK